MYEGRFAKLFHPVTGVITWMSNPAQPSMVWQLYSHDLEPNASLFAVRKACEPVHVQMNQSDFHIMVINATATARSGLHVRTRIVNLDGTVAADFNRPVEALASAATDLGAIDFPEQLSPMHFVKLELLNERGEEISNNFYWRTNKMVQSATAPATASAPASSQPTTQATRPARRGRPQLPQEDFTDLQKLPLVPIAMTTIRHDADGKCVLEATVTNKGSAVALLVHLQLRNGATGERILPVYYTDNYISLLPGESRRVSIEAAVDCASRRSTDHCDRWLECSSGRMRLAW